MASAQVNLFLFAGVVVLLCLSVTPVEADQCGYHYHTNEYFTIYYSAYYKRCYPIYYGYCYNGFWNQEIHGTNAEERLYYCKIISYFGKRSSSTGKVDTYSATTNRDTGLSENDQRKRDLEVSDKIKKRMQVSDYAEILKALGQKRTERAFQLSNISEDQKEAEKTIEQA